MINQFSPAAVAVKPASPPSNLASDPLGGIAGVTWETLAARDRLVFDLCLERSLPIVVNLAGGYQEDGSTVRGHIETFWQAWAACGRV